LGNWVTRWVTRTFAWTNEEWRGSDLEPWKKVAVGEHCWSRSSRRGRVITDAFVHGHCWGSTVLRWRCSVVLMFWHRLWATAESSGACKAVWLILRSNDGRIGNAKSSNHVFYRKMSHLMLVFRQQEVAKGRRTDYGPPPDVPCRSPDHGSPLMFPTFSQPTSPPEIHRGRHWVAYIPRWRGEARWQ